MKTHSTFFKNAISLITLFFIAVNAYAQPNPTTLGCGVSSSQSLTANGYTGSNPTASTGSCGQCCYQGSDLDGDGDQEVSFSVENSKWYRYCNPGGTAVTIDFIIDEVNNDCNLQGAVFVTAGSSSSGTTDALDIDCSNQEFQEFGSNVSGNADGFSFTGITIPPGGCAWVMVDGYGGATCGAFTVNTVCPPLCTVPTSFTAGIDITICEGSSGTINSTVSGGLTSGSGLVYSWSPTTGLSSPTVADPVASPTSTTTYTMTACNGGTGFCCVTDQVTVTVTPNFVANAGADITACAPSSLTIGGAPTGPSGSTYSWVETTTNAGIAISGSSAIANPTVAISAGATGSAVYTVTVINGACTRTDAVTITVGPLAVSAGSAQDVCAGSAVTIGGSPTAPAGSTYAWTCSGVACANLTLSSSTTANPIVTANAAATGTATYTVTATLGTCINTSTVVVTVNPLPTTPTATPSVSPICAGTSVTLTAADGAGAGTYSWWTASSGGTQQGTGNTLIVSPNTTTTYYIQSTNATTGCTSARGDVTITVNLTPVANAGSDITVCAGFPVNLSGTITNPAGCSPAQTWTVVSGTGTFGNANNLNTTFTPTSAGTIQLTLTPCTSGGCTAIADNLIITVTPAPTVTASVTSSPVCSGLITDLNAVATGGTPNPPTITTNSFSSAVGPFNIPNNDCTTGVSIPISVTGVSNATVGTTTVSVCVNINHNQLGNVSLKLCAPGGSPCITLVPDPPGNGGPPGGSNYTNTCFTGTATTDIASGTAPYTGSFNPYGTVSMTDLNGASTNGTWTLTVFDCNAGSSGTAGQWTINFSTPVASNPYTYSWSPVLGLSAPTEENTSFFTSSFAAPTAVTETVTVTDANGCTGTSNVIIDIITTPATDAGPVQTICGTSATFAANALGVGETGVWSVFSGSGTITTANSPASTITGLGSGSNVFQWTVTNTCGSTSDQVQITSNPDATIALSSAAATNAQAVCTSTPITNITYIIGGGGTGATVGGLPAGITGIFNAGVFTISGASSNAGTYSYTVTTTGTCTQATDNGTIIIVPPPSAPTAPSPAVYCQGNVIADLTATGTGGTLTWFSNPGLTTQVGTGSPFTSGVTSTSTFYVTETVSGCQSPATAVIITVNPPPSAPSASSPAPYCQGATIADLTATGTGGTLTWYSDSGLSTQAGTGSPFASGVTSTSTFYVTETVSGCQSPATAVTITFNSAPLAPLAPSPSAYCQGATIADLTATGTGGTLTWFSNPGLTTQVGTGSPFTSGATNTSTFYVTETLSGCQSPATAVTIVFNTLPATPTASVTFQPDCITGGTIVVTAPSGGNIQYSIGGAYQSGGTFSGLPPATYSITAQNTTTTCISPDTILIVNSPPGAPSAPIAASPSAYCQGATIADLTAIGTGGTLTWYSNSGLTTQVGTGSPFASGVTSTSTFYVTETVSGCQSSATTVTITVNTPPSAPTAQSPAAYCQGATIADLTATGTGSLTWYSDAGLTTQVGTGSPFASGATSTSTFYVTQTVSGCEGLATAVTITINAPPSAPSAASPAAYCQGATIASLTATGTGGTLTWYSNSGLTTQIGTGSPFASGATNTSTYYVTETVSGCQSLSTAVTITVNPAPAAPTAPSPAAYCQGATIADLTATGTGIFTWYSNPGLTTQVGTGSPFATGATSTSTYYVTQTVSGCSGPATAVTITVNPAPAAPTAPSPAPYCQGATIAGLTASGAGGALFTWYSDPGLTTQVGTGSPFASGATSTSTYYVTQTVSGCPGPATAVTITVNPIPSTPNASSNSPVCAGSPLNLTSGTVTNATYSWSGPNVYISSVEDPTVSSSATIIMSGTYSVTVTVAGCTSLADTVNVIVNPNPIVSAGTDATILYGSSITLSATSSISGAYFWSTGELTNSISVSPIVTTEYCVTITTPTCVDSNCVIITVDMPCGKLFVPTGFSPNGDNENDVLKIYGDCITSFEFAIFDRWGEKVFESNDPTMSWDGTIKGKKLDAAVFVYYLKATIKGEAVSKHGNITLMK